MKTKKASFFIIVCAVSIMAGVFMGSGTGLLSGGSYNLEQLRGAVDCNNCQDANSEFYECYHSNLDPDNTKCDMNECITNWHWWWECDVTDGNDDCDQYYDANSYFVIQVGRKDISCSPTDPNDDGTGGFYFRQCSDECTDWLKDEEVKCITSGCSGGTIDWFHVELGLWKCL